MPINRKDAHLSIALSNHHQSNDFDKIQLFHQNLAGISVSDIDLSSVFLGYEVNYPFYINAMTGGTQNAYIINEKLARIANHFGIPMMVGSQMITFRETDAKDSFLIVKESMKDGIIVANINANATPQQALSAVEMIGASGLAIHLNILQELSMTEGDRDFKDWFSNIKKILKIVKVPVIIKEVGFGLSIHDIKKLYEIGVRYVDVSGHGGTNFGHIEATRANEMYLFDGIGLSTVDALIEAHALKEKPILYASGGIRNPLDTIKALILGAEMVGLSKWFLDLTKLTFDDAINTVTHYITNLKKIMTALGAKEISNLSKIAYRIKP